MHKVKLRLKLISYENCTFDSLITIFVYTNTANSLTEKLISTVLDFDIKGNFAVLQPWIKIVEIKVENPVNSRNESIF